MVSETFGDMLYPGVEFLEFPSPEELKGKILISTKPPKEPLGSFTEQENQELKIEELTDRSGNEELDINIQVLSLPHLDLPCGTSHVQIMVRHYE